MNNLQDVDNSFRRAFFRHIAQLAWGSGIGLAALGSLLAGCRHSPNASQRNVQSKTAFSDVPAQFNTERGKPVEGIVLCAPIEKHAPAGVAHYAYCKESTQTALFSGSGQTLATLEAMPGSTMKLVTAAVLLSQYPERIVERYDCRGKTTVQGQQVTCPEAHGVASLTQAIAQSCNGYFAHAGAGIPAEALLKRAGLWWDKSFEHLSPDVLNPVWLPVGLEPHVTLTPNQALHWMHCLALREAGSIPLTEATWRVLEAGMQGCAEYGTAAGFRPQEPDSATAAQPYRYALKTGTLPSLIPRQAQHTSPWHREHWSSWVMGYGPLHAPLAQQQAVVALSLTGSSKVGAVPLLQKAL